MTNWSKITKQQDKKETSHYLLSLFLKLSFPHFSRQSTLWKSHDAWINKNF
jgi:hypothetical protein